MTECDPKLKSGGGISLVGVAIPDEGADTACDPSFNGGVELWLRDLKVLGDAEADGSGWAKEKVG